MLQALQLGEWMKARRSTWPLLLLLLATLAAASASRPQYAGHTTAAQPSLLGRLPAFTRGLLSFGAQKGQQSQTEGHVSARRQLLISTGNDTCSLRPTSVSTLNQEVRAEATMSVDYGTRVSGYFRMRFVDCSPEGSSMCSNSTYNKEPGVFKVRPAGLCTEEQSAVCVCVCASSAGRQHWMRKREDSTQPRMRGAWR